MPKRITAEAGVKGPGESQNRPIPRPPQAYMRTDSNSVAATRRVVVLPQDAPEEEEPMKGKTVRALVCAKCSRIHPEDAPKYCSCGARVRPGRSWEERGKPVHAQIVWLDLDTIPA